MKMNKLCSAFVILLLVLMIFTSSAFGADSSFNHFWENAQKTDYLNYSDMANGGSLAWGEFYYLDSYLNMYDATRDKEWLDKVVDHVDRMITNAVDVDGDGYEGWPDARYAHNQLKNGDLSIAGAASGASEIISNGSFEADANSDNVPDGWTRQGNTAKTYRSVAAGDAYTGSAGLIVESDGTNSNRLVQGFSYTAGKTYTVEVFAGVETEKSEAIIEIFNTTTNSVLAYTRVHHVGFERYTFNFTAPSSGTLQIRLGLENYKASGYKARFDAVSIKETDTVPGEKAINGSFETVDGSDSTLPANWSRWSSSNSSNIYLVTGINNYHAGARGVAVKTDNTSWEVLEQAMTYTASQQYTVSFWGRVSDNRYGGRVEIYNATDGTVLESKAFYDTTWRRQSFTFTAPSVSGKTLKIRLYQTKWDISGFTSYFDQISVKPVVQTAAAAWSYSNVSLANAHRTNKTDANPYNDWGMELIHNGSSDPVIGQYLDNYKPNSPYTFSSYSKVTPGTTGAMRVYDVTAGAALGTLTFTNSDIFEKHDIDFTTPAAGHQIRLEVYINYGSSGQKLYAYSLFAGQRWEHMVHEGVIGSVMLRFVRTVYEDSSLSGSYGAKADTYRNFVADNLVHKWDSYWRQITGTDGSNNGTGVYVFPAGLSTEWFPTRSLPHNQYLALAKMLYILYDVTDGVSQYASDRQYYLSRANDMERAFKGKVRVHKLDANAYEWSYWDSMGSWDDGHYYSTNAEDLSHAAITMSSVLEAYHYGQVFTLSDMQKFARTFTNIMWNGSLSDPVLSYYNNRVPSITADKENSDQYYHWIDFSEFNHTVWDIADAISKEGRSTVYAGSGIGKWSRNKSINPGFETVDIADSTLPMYWTRWQSTSTTAYRDNASPYAGDWYAAVKTNGTSWQILQQQLSLYEPNTAYTLSFAGKTNGNVGGRAEVYDYTSSTILSSITFTETSWTDKSFTFTTPSVTNHNIQIRLYHTSYTPTNGIAYFDEVHALPYLYNSQIPNGSFETADTWDSTLPLLWKRGNTSVTSNVAADTGTCTSGGRSIKLSTAANGAAQELIYNWKGYKPGSTYQFTVKGKTNGSNARGRLKVIDVTNNNAVLVNILIDGTSWTTYTGSFTTPSAYDHQLDVIITHDNPQIGGGNVWADDLGIYLN